MREKKKYSKPILIYHGDLKKITKEEGTGGYDGYSGSHF